MLIIWLRSLGWQWIFIIFNLFICFSWFIVIVTLLSYRSKNSHLFVDNNFDLFGNFSLLSSRYHSTANFSTTVGLLLLINNSRLLWYHKLIEFVITIRLYLFQEIVHLQSLSITWYLTSSKNIRVMLLLWSHVQIIVLNHLLLLML